MKNPRLSAVKVSAELNEQFSTLISFETFRSVLRESGLREHSDNKNFFVSEKTERSSFHSQNQ